MFFCISFLLIIDTCYHSFIGFSQLCNDSHSHKHPHLCSHKDFDCMRSQISVRRCAPVGLLQWWKALLGKASGNFLALCSFGQKHHTLKKWKKDVNGHIPVSRPTPVERSSNVIICSKSKTPLFVYMITSTGFLFVHSGYGLKGYAFWKHSLGKETLESHMPVRTGTGWSPFRVSKRFCFWVGFWFLFLGSFFVPFSWPQTLLTNSLVNKVCGQLLGTIFGPQNGDLKSAGFETKIWPKTWPLLQSMLLYKQNSLEKNSQS